MSVTLNQEVQNILALVETLTESDYFSLLDELIEKDPEFQDIFDRLVDAESTRIPELTNLRPQSKMMRQIKINALTYYEFIDRGFDELTKQMNVSTATGEWLDQHGKDVGLTRKSLAKATGAVLVGSSLLPDATYDVPELFSVGTKGSVDQEAIKFVGLNTPSIDPSIQIDADGDYTVELQIEAIEGGQAGNLSPLMITILIL